MDVDRSLFSRRRLLQGSAGLGAMWALSACGAGGGSTQSSGDAPALGTSTEDFLGKAGKTLGTSSISLLAYAAPQGESIRALAGQFTELTGITVDWTSLDEQSAANRATVALGSGSGGYDVVQTTSALLPSYVDRGWLASLDELAADATATIPAWDASAYGTGITNLLSSGGALYAAPMFLGTQVFYYRTDVFEQKGITSPPTTFVELRDVCAKVHGDDVSAIALRSAPSPSQLMFVWSAWMYGFGGKYYASYSDGAYDGVAFDSPETVAALTLYTDLLQQYAPTGATNWSVEDVARAFSTGQVAIVQEGAVFGGTFNDPKGSQVAGKVGSFVIPAGPAGSFVPYVSHGWGVAANSKKQQAAWLFAQWATLQKTLTAATQTDVNFASPPLAAVYESKEYGEKYGFDDYISTVTGTISAANDGGVSPYEGDPNYLPGIPEWNTIGQKVCEQLSRAVTGEISPQEAVTAAAAQISA